MPIEDSLTILIPDIDDPHTTDTTEIRSFFLTVARLVSADFMGIEIRHDNHLVLDSQRLKTIYNAYKGNLVNSDYVVRVFIASTYHLPTLQPDIPSSQWLWVAKVCHLLLYFAQHDLVQRIRETSVESRKWLNPTHANHPLWQLCCDELQAPTLEHTYQNFTQYRQRLESNNDPNLKGFCKIYRTIDFAFNERQRITRQSSGRRKSSQHLDRVSDTAYVAEADIDDDADELVSVIDYEQTEGTVDKYRERLDDPVPNFTYLKQSSLQPTEKYSYNQIYRRTQAKYAHANKNERFVSANIRQLPLTLLQNIVAKLWQWFDAESGDDAEKNKRDRKRAVAYLLLSIYTGRSVSRLAEDINEKHKKLVDIMPRKKSYTFNIHLDITGLGLQTAGIETVIANRLTKFTLPLPPRIGVFLTYKGMPKTTAINEVIADLRHELSLPLISLARIEKSLYGTLIHEVSTSQFASIITGRNDRKRADLWYCSHPIRDTKLAYQKAIELLTARCVNADEKIKYLADWQLSDHAIGSQNSPDYPLVAIFLEHLRRQVETHTDYIAKFNAYNLWLWHVSLLLTSVRAVEGSPGMLNQFNLSTGLAWISDKEERVSTGSQRLVPICHFLSIAIENFLDYLRGFAKRFGRLNNHINRHIDDILNSRRPLLNHLNADGSFDSLRPAIVGKELKDNFRFKVDWTRHVGQRFLHQQDVEEALILAIFGHEMVGQETWRKQSSLSLGDILSVKDDYEALAKRLELQQVSL